MEKISINTLILPLAATALVFTSSGCDSMTTEEVHDPSQHRVPGSLYAAAVVFPAGYDWRRDSLALKDGLEIAFFRDTSLLLCFPAYEGGPGIDADMHRICGNHLYSDYTDKDNTCIAVDGRQRFSYEGREMIRGFMVSDTNIFTLGTSREGKGWSFRKNGALLSGRDSGEPVGSLYADCGEFCFSYGMPVPSSGTGGAGTAAGSATEYFFVSDGEERAIDAILEDESNAGTTFPGPFLDIRRSGGTFNFLYANPEGYGVLWTCEGKMFLIDNDGTDRYRNCHFASIGGSLYAAVTACPETAGHTSFWDIAAGKRVVRTEYPSSSKVYSVCDNAPLLCFAVTEGGGAGMEYVYCNGKKTRIGRNFLILSPQSLCCDSYGFAIGLNDSNDGFRPLVIRGKDTLRYDFNGYFIHLALP